VSSQLLDEFRDFLGEHQIQPSVGEWSSIRDYVALRLKQEILNQSRGIAAGDEVEVKRDTVVRRALEELTGKR